MWTIGLLRALVDDAGLFPPAKLPMAEAVARHRADLKAAHPMLTHRFLCTASRLDELTGALVEGDRVRVGLILDTALPEDVDPRLEIELVERPLPAGDQPALAEEALDRLKGFPGQVYLEPKRGPGWLEAIPVIASHGRGAKVRCGGMTPELFPSAGELAAFITTCVRENVAFKATAGLHHALPHTDEATGFDHHGYLTVLLAVARAVEGADEQAVAAVLSETEVLAEVAALDEATVRRTRELLVSYGSCSTSEPIEDAVALGLAGH